MRDGRITNLLCILLLLSGCISVAQAADQLEPQALYQKALPSVMTLLVDGRDGSKRLGTAVLVRDGLAATAWHVVRDAGTVTAVFSNGERFDVSGLVDKDEKRDVALVKVKVFGRPSLVLATDEPAIGSKACVIGAPQGLEFSISDGLVSQIQMMDGVKYYQFTCAASPGNSGGPLIDDKGQVTGIVSWQVRDGQNLNFAIPSTYVLGLDATLPTQPWNAVSPSAASATSEIEMSDDDADRLLAHAICLGLDGSVVGMYIDEPVSMTRKRICAIYQAYNDEGIQQCCYYINEECDRVFAMLAGCISDSSRGRIARVCRDRISLLSQKSGLFLRGLRGREGYKWTPAAEDLMAQASAKRLPDVSYSAADIKALMQSKAFAGSLPIDAQCALIGDNADDTGMTLGTSSFLLTKPMVLQVVPKDSFGYSLGLRVGDTVTSVDGRAVKSWLDVRKAIKSRCGQRCKIGVVRSDGETHTLEPKIPKELPGCALTSAKPK